MREIYRHALGVLGLMLGILIAVGVVGPAQAVAAEGEDAEMKTEEPAGEALAEAAGESSEVSIESLVMFPSMNVVLSSSDLDKSEAFYGEVLGLKPMAPLMLPGNMKMPRFKVGTSEIKFLKGPDSIPNQTGGVRDAIGIRLLTFYLPDSPELDARLEAYRNDALSYIKLGGSRRLTFVEDPDGNAIELMLLPADSPAESFDKLAIGLTVSDIDASRAFYGDFLGLEDLGAVDVALLGGKKYSYRHGTTVIKFWSFGGDLPVHSGLWQDAVGIRYIQYIVRDLDAVDAHARSEGANIHTPIFNLGKMARIMFIADPDGIINEFVGLPKR